MDNVIPFMRRCGTVDTEGMNQEKLMLACYEAGIEDGAKIADKHHEQNYIKLGEMREKAHKNELARLSRMRQAWLMAFGLSCLFWFLVWGLVFGGLFWGLVFGGLFG